MDTWQKIALPGKSTTSFIEDHSEKAKPIEVFTKVSKTDSESESKPIRDSKRYWKYFLDSLIDHDLEKLKPDTTYNNKLEEFSKDATEIFNCVKAMGGAFYECNHDDDDDAKELNDDKGAISRVKQLLHDAYIKKKMNAETEKKEEEISKCKLVSLEGTVESLSLASENEKNKLEETSRTDKWKDYIANHQDIGLITLFFRHTVIPEETGFFPSFLPFGKFVLLSIFIIQWYLFVVLLQNALTCYKISTGISNDQKTLACFVAFIYFVNLALLGMQRHRELKGSPLTKTAQGGKLQNTVLFDRIMSYAYEPLLSLINVFYLFIQKDKINIIVNAMAFHFIIEMKDIVKTMFIKSFPPNIPNYQDLNNEDNPHASGSTLNNIFLSSDNVNIGWTILCCIGVLVIMIMH